MYNDGRFDEAMKTLDEVLKINPESTGALYNIACCYASTNRNEEALEIAEHLMNVLRDNPIINCFVGGVLNFRHRKQWESMFEDGIVIENIDIGEAVNELVLPTNGKKGQGTCIVCLLLNMILSRIQSCEVARTVLRGHLQLWGEHLSLHPRSRSPGELH